MLVKATFDKSYELILSPMQTAALVPFNDGACVRVGLRVWGGEEVGGGGRRAF